MNGVSRGKSQGVIDRSKDTNLLAQELTERDAWTVRQVVVNHTGRFDELGELSHDSDLFLIGGGRQEPWWLYHDIRSS